MRSFVKNKFCLILSDLQQSLRTFRDNLFLFYKHPRINDLFIVESYSSMCVFSLWKGSPIPGFSLENTAFAIATKL